MRKVVPDVTVRYHHSVIHAKGTPFRFAEFIFRKAAHLFVYAVLTGFAYTALLSFGCRLLYRILGAVGYTILIASLDEWNQSKSALRTSSVQDIVLDTVGGCFGLLLAMLGTGIIYRIMQSRKSRKGYRSC